MRRAGGHGLPPWQPQQPEGAQAEAPGEALRNIRPASRASGARHRHRGIMATSGKRIPRWYYATQDRMRGNGRHGTVIGGVPWGGGYVGRSIE